MRLLNTGRQRGFSLIELMITVAIVAVLASIAGGSYLASLARGDRSIAIGDLVKISQALERYYSFNRTYTAKFSDLSMSSSDPDNLYSYSITNGGQSFIIYAAPNKSRDKWTLGIDDLGFKTHYPSTSTPPANKTDGWP